MIWDVHPQSWILNPDPDLFASLGISDPDPRSRDQKNTGSRIPIESTISLIFVYH
jgi:hypothetical protein